MYSLSLQVRIDASTFTYITVFQGVPIDETPPVLEAASTPQIQVFPGPEMFIGPIPANK